MNSALPEIREIERILERGRPHLEATVLDVVRLKSHLFPIYKIALGNPDPSLPGIGFFGGVHGLERIGTHVLLNFLNSLVARLRWDKSMHHLLGEMRIIFMPCVNPGGMWQSTRCNPHGVDLMRNAPVEAEGELPFLLAGHRYSRHLPWYRGAENAAMEIENQALCLAVKEELLPREFSMAIDCHSGFGMRDRIWFPLAHSVHPIKHLAEVLHLEELFYQSHPKHRYIFEPQSMHYRTHGDIWDYLYLQSQKNDQKTFLPFTLEMGSWLWVKKNPMQLFSRHGMFNPNAEHRLHRTLRRHNVCLDFLMHAACSYENWRIQGASRMRLQERGVARWYR
jgi:hypothetical protein